MNSADARALLAELDTALERLTGSSGRGSFSPEDVQQAGATFAVAYWDGAPIACGGFRPLTKTTAEIKRVYARPNRVGVRASSIGNVKVKQQTVKVKGGDFPAKQAGTPGCWWPENTTWP